MDALKIGKVVFEDKLWSAFDKGDINSSQVIEAYSKEYPEYAQTIQWFIEHGEYMHVARKNVWEKISKLKKKGYKIYLLSNYSEELFKKHTKGALFLDYIDGKVVSYEIHTLKPDPRIYEYLFQKYLLNPEESFFFDDREENVEAGKKAGMPGLLVTSEEQLLEYLDTL